MVVRPVVVPLYRFGLEVVAVAGLVYFLSAYLADFAGLAYLDFAPYYPDSGLDSAVVALVAESIAW